MIDSINLLFPNKDLIFVKIIWPVQSSEPSGSNWKVLLYTFLFGIMIKMNND